MDLISNLLASPLLVSPQLGFLDIGGGEFIVIMLVALVLFGGRLPDVARTVGRTVGNLKRQADDLTREFRDEFNDASRTSSGRPRYDPPPRVVPTKDKRSLPTGGPAQAGFPEHDGDEHATVPDPDPDHEGSADSLTDEDDAMGYVPEEELRRAAEEATFSPTPFKAKGDRTGLASDPSDSSDSEPHTSDDEDRNTESGSGSK